jgi:hypothetical protein
MPIKFRHFGIVVEDLETCINFWKTFFRFEIVIDQLELSPYIDTLLALNAPNLHTVKLSDSKGMIVELLKFQNYKVSPQWEGSVKSTGLTHIALTVCNLKELLSELTKAGYSTFSPIQISPDKKVKVVFLNGPENLILELVEEL